MVDRAADIALLEELRTHTSLLASKPRLDEDFQRWRRDVLNALERVFGPDSREKREFDQLRFQINRELRERVEARIRLVLQERLGLEAPSEMHIPEDHYYKERLQEAAELLLAMIVVLRRSADP